MTNNSLLSNKNRDTNIKIINIDQQQHNAIEKEWYEIQRQTHIRIQAYKLEAIRYLKQEQVVENPEELLKRLFKIYRTIDHYADYILPGERDFFPQNMQSRTLERYLKLFKTLYSILLRIENRLRLQRVFDQFWQRCLDYLSSSSPSYPSNFLEFIKNPHCPFKEKSFYFWRKLGKDNPEFLEQMWLWFRNCFGVEGMEELCQVPPHSGEWDWNWHKMKRCYEEFNDHRR